MVSVNPHVSHARQKLYNDTDSPFHAAKSSYSNESNS